RPASAWRRRRTAWYETAQMKPAAGASIQSGESQCSPHDNPASTSTVATSASRNAPIRFWSTSSSRTLASRAASRLVYSSLGSTISFYSHPATPTAPMSATAREHRLLRPIDPRRDHVRSGEAAGRLLTILIYG